MKIENITKRTFSTSFFPDSRIIKALFVAVFAGFSVICNPTCADALSDELSKKPLTTPTLDYLKEKNILIPQKDAASITSPGSAYTITDDGTQANHAFEYLIVDQDGNITTKYYNINLKDSDYLKFGTSKNITWTEVAKPDEDSEVDDSIIQVDFPNDVKKYFQYTYNASGYANIKDQEAVSELVESETSDTETINCYVGGVIKVKEGETETITNTLFLNNKVEITDAENVYDILYGGALYNEGTITEIAADFIGNSAYASYKAHGGAIANDGTIINITGDFISNSASNSYSNYSVYGGAIFNENTIKNITGDFIGNSATSSGKTYGGAISNYAYNISENNITNASIGKITGNFVGNSILASSNKSTNYSFGGAISNYSYGYGEVVIEDIAGNFIGNTAFTSEHGTTTHGGAISNTVEYYGSAIIKNITGDFIENSVDAYGGAISNYSYIYSSATIGNITGNFMRNYSSHQGGGIHNETYYAIATIGNITGDFIRNTASHGGAIYNIASGEKADYSPAEAIIGDIYGDFIENDATLTNQSYGGAIFNQGENSGKATIGNIFGDFIANEAGRGSAIYNYASSGVAIIGDIFGDFIDNNASQSGGVIYNISKATIGNIFGDFIGNTAFSDGGAINTSGTIGNITGDFIRNIANRGGAIYKTGGTIGDITGDFIENSANTDGGAIYNSSGKIGNIIGDFNTNTVDAYDSRPTATANASGDAIYNKGTIGNITGDFNTNTAKAEANAYTTTKATATATACGEAIYNKGTIGNVAGNFDNNTAKAIVDAAATNNNKPKATATATAYGGAIYSDKAIGNITGDFNNNTVTATANARTVTNDNATATATAYGGAIYNAGLLGEKDANGNIIGGVINSNFYNNYAKANSQTGLATAQGGAIWTSKDFNIIADNGSSTFEGNYVQVDDGEIDYQAIWVNSSSATLGFIVRNGGEINIYDNIAGVEGFTVKLTNDGTGTLNLFGNIENASVVVDDNPIVNLTDDIIHEYKFFKLNSSPDAKYILDIDFKKKTSDKIIVGEGSSGTILIDEFNILGYLAEKPDKDYKFEILFAHNDDIQLKLSPTAISELPDEEVYLGQYLRDVYDIANAITNWKDIYKIYDQKVDVYGNIQLSTTKTTHDSVGVEVSREDPLLPLIEKGMSDTLALWNQLDTEDKKEFKFDTEDDKYFVAEKAPSLTGLGETQGRELTINGKIDEENRSTIDMHSRKGFEIKQDQTFNVNNVNMVEAKERALEVTNPDAVINLYNTSFFNNKSSESGAAIYSMSDVNMTADGALVWLYNNKISINDEDEDNARYESVYIANEDKALNLDIKNNGIFKLDDSINGETGYKVKVTGDGTGTLNLFGDIKNANVEIGNVAVDFRDGVNRTYEFESLQSSEEAKYYIGIDFIEKTSDKFVTSNESSGVVTIAGLQIANNEEEMQDIFNKNYTIKILDAPTGSLRLALSEELAHDLDEDEYKIGRYVETRPDEINPITEWNHDYRIKEQEVEIYGKLGLKDSKDEKGTTYDSIGINVSRYKDEGGPVDIGSQGGALRLWNMLETDKDKIYYFEKATDVFLAAKDFPEVQSLGETKGDNLTISGVIEGNERSTIDLNHLKGFDLKHDATFNINNISFKNGHDRVFEVTSDNAIIEFVNTSFINNIALEQGGAIYSKSNVNMTSKGEGVVTELTGNTVNGSGEALPESVYIADATKALTINVLENATFTLNDAINGVEGYDVNIKGDSTSTFKLFGDIQNADVNVEGQLTVKLANGINQSLVFESLNSDENAKYIIDIDFSDNSCDNFTTLNKSQGTVTITELQMANLKTEFDPDNLPKFQILHTQDDGLQLALADEISSDESRIAVSIDEVLEEIKPTTKWNYNYKVYEQEKDIYGELSLATTDTENDSIGMKITHIELKDLIEKGSQGSAITLWTGLDTAETKNFNFDTANDKINIDKTGLGELKGNEIYINGVIDRKTPLTTRSVLTSNPRSTINFNNLKGFKLNHGAKLNISNVSLENANDRALEVNDSNAQINLTNTNLINNKSSRQGGAIYSNSDVNITADNATSEITGNSINKTNEAIYIANKDKKLTLKTSNKGVLTLNDLINGKKGYTVDITGDSTGRLNLFNDLNNANVLLNGSTINAVNNQVHVYNFNELQLKNNTNFIADVDLLRKEMDRFTADSYGDHGNNKLNVIGMNLLQTGVPEDEIIPIFFAEKGLKNNVDTTVSEVAYSPIYKYKVRYDNRNDGGYFVFDRSGGRGGNSSSVFNPAILSTSVATVAGVQATVNETFNHAFEHSDWFTKFPSSTRKVVLNPNKYAYSTDFNENIPQLLQQNKTNQAGWYRPYVTFEKISLRNGPKVDATLYGSLAGFDTEMFKHKNGWYSVGTGYVGYNGSKLNYSGVGTVMNGGLLGYTHTAYKNNFWSALTLSAGASVGNIDTMYGRDDVTFLYSGVGSKTGYNFEFKEGKYILQPIMFMSYTFANPFDYTNAADVRVNARSAHSIMLNPSVRFIANTKNGWQPYANVGMVWNVMNENKVVVSDVTLPTMRFKPYVEYGVGVQKSWKDSFTAYGQVMLRNGGINGVALQLGFRWLLGKDPKTVKPAIKPTTKRDLASSSKHEFTKQFKK